MTKFKEGDKFIPHKPKEDNPDLSWVEEMDIYDGKTQIVHGISDNGWIEAEECFWYFHPDWCEKVEGNQSVETNEKVEENHIPEVGNMVGSSEIPNGQEHIVEANKMVDWEQRRYELAKTSMHSILSNSDILNCAMSKGVSNHRLTIIVCQNAIIMADDMIKQLKGQQNTDNSIVGNNDKEKGLSDLRTILLKIETYIELQNGVTKGQLQELWNSVSNAIDKLEK